MIDLHSHILPGVDDGAPDLEAAIAIARMAVDDGIEVMAATPHFMPGLYDNEAHDIRARVAYLNDELHHRGINLAVVVGADAHIRPDLLNCLRQGEVLTLHDTRYFLFEPPHITAPQRLEELLFNIQVSGYVPILTHPERLKWIEQRYDLMVQLARAGVWMQITSGSLTGRFGSRAQYWGQRMLAEGLVQILATDAHNVSSRPPLLAESFSLACAEVGLDEATHLVLTRPQIVLENQPPENAPPVLVESAQKPVEQPFWRRLFAGTN